MPHPGKGDEISITSTRKARQAAGQYHYRTRDTWSLSRMKILSRYEQTSDCLPVASRKETRTFL